MAETNKVRFGIKSCYYSVITRDENGTITYGTPVAFPGAVSLSLDAQGGDPEPFYADDIIYYQSPGANTGYSGSFTVARIIDSFHKDVLGYVEDDNGLLLEDADAMSKEFALMVQFSGDKHNTRHVLYNCTASRSSFGSSTIEDKATPQTEEFTITAIPATFKIDGQEDRHIVKAKCVQEDSATQYAAWFTKVQVPSLSGGVSA